MRLRVIIVDDERIARRRLRRLLEREADFEIVAEAGDGVSAVKAVHKYAPDLILLDVQMPGMNGFEVIDALGVEQAPATVFITAYDQHAIRAFESHALDYLLKPVSPERFAKMLARARERFASPWSKPQALLDLIAERKAATARAARLVVRIGDRTVFIAPEEVDWVEAAGNYALLHLGKQTHILRQTMSTLEAELLAWSFLRVSRSAILNLRRVQELRYVAPGEHVAILNDGQRVTITRSMREVEDRLRRA